ncbi:prenyltransferase [Hypoxylon rubiginosum]|uniref:Prenyltransferase n=1 Tax=Hypoxylon rubiginosum TaxID=110542 RepID=A0ACB9Z1L4_9PEZI|nr:prenyltransferase [Hypoxylon rubiginosum]
MSTDREKKALSRADEIDTKDTTKDTTLARQYGGIHAGGWVNLLPASWIPYVQLARLSPPAGVFLIYFPHVFGALHAANLLRLPANELAWNCATLLGGTFFFSNAAHAWNDLIDAPVDAQIPRTKTRPIPRGAVSPLQALVFTGFQTVAAAAFLPLFPPETALATVPSIVATTYYPWAKLHTYFPQLVLGFWIAWGIVVGSAASGVTQPWSDVPVLCLVTVCILWTTIYDTIYAFQDVKDDVKIGVKSTAVLFKAHTKTLLWSLIVILGACMLLYGNMMEMGVMYHVAAVGGGLSSLAAMVANVELKNDASCWWWFSCGFWVTGVTITVGLLAEYLVSY